MEVLSQGSTTYHRHHSIHCRMSVIFSTFTRIKYNTRTVVLTTMLTSTDIKQRSFSSFWLPRGSAATANRLLLLHWGAGEMYVHIQIDLFTHFYLTRWNAEIAISFAHWGTDLLLPHPLNDIFIINCAWKWSVYLQLHSVLPRAWSINERQHEKLKFERMQKRFNISAQERTVNPISKSDFSATIHFIAYCT